MAYELRIGNEHADAMCVIGGGEKNDVMVETHAPSKMAISTRAPRRKAVRWVNC